MVEHVLWDPLRGAGTYGMPISKMLFWISCFPNMMILSWMQSSIRQPPGAHCEEKVKDVMTVLWIELHNHYYFILQYSCRIRILIFMAVFLDSFSIPKPLSFYFGGKVFFWRFICVSHYKGRWLVNVGFPNTHYKWPKLRTDVEMSLCEAAFTMNWAAENTGSWAACL